MTRPTIALALSCALLSVAPRVSAEAKPPKTISSKAIYVQPLGKALPDRDVKLVVVALRSFYGLEVKLLPRMPLPTSAYYKPRRRYRAEKLLDILAPKLPADGLRILGLTGADISTTKGRYRDWGVIGLATMDGRACVISSFRCHKKARSIKQARERLAKVAVHEIGHTLGLEHCPKLGCLMEDAKGKVKTSDGEYDLCPVCRKTLKTKGWSIPATPATYPWPRPRGFR